MRAAGRNEANTKGETEKLKIVYMLIGLCSRHTLSTNKKEKERERERERQSDRHALFKG
jgi:uncharacterized membrane protein YuzA (DUF378 family)